jgi:hypothetical protein
VGGALGFLHRTLHATGRDVGGPERSFHLLSGFVRRRGFQVVFKVLEGVFDAGIEAGRNLFGGLVDNPSAEAGAKGGIQSDGGKKV